MTEEDHRTAEPPQGGQPIGDVIEPDVESLDVAAPATRRAEAAQVERPGVKAACGEDPRRPLVAAAMLAQPGDDQDARPRLTRRRPVADGQ